MKFVLQMIVTLSIFSLVFSDIVRAKGDIKKDLAKEVVRLSGIDRQIDSIPGFVTQLILSDGGFSDHPGLSERINQLGKEAYDSNRAQNVLIHHFLNHAQAKDFELMLVWFDSPLGRRLTKAEVDSTTLQGQKKLTKFLKKFKLPFGERAHLMRQFEESAGLTDNFLKIMETVMHEMISAMMEFYPDRRARDQNLLNAEMEKTWEQNKPEMKKKYYEMMILQTFYVYQSFSNAEVDRYIGFLNSPIGKKLSELSVNAMTLVINDYLEKYMRSMIFLVKSWKGQKA